MTWLTSWRLALRLARRDLLKHRARAIIALVMVTLPVFGVVAADVLIQTSSVSATEGIDRRLGTVATAKVEIAQDAGTVTQAPDPQTSWSGTDQKSARPRTYADIAAVIGQRSAIPVSLEGEILARTTHGREPMRADQIAAGDRLATGLYRLTQGHWPTAPDEVVVNQAARDRGIGSTLEVVGADRVETPHRIVGTIVDATARNTPVVVAPYGAFPGTAYFGGERDRTWLVDGPPITWRQVLALNKVGVLVTDRQIASHPGDYPDALAYSAGSGDNTTAEVAVLVVVMALIEVVLLAGPAFAVGARKQQRSLALLVSAGGTPAQSRRVILAGGLLLGVTAGVVGIVAGIAAAWALQPVAQRFNGEWLGPFDVSWWHVLGVAAFGLVSALVACVVPAWIASRQNVVAVLAGRRGEAKPVRAFPIIGLALFVVGVLIAVAGARGGGDLTVAWSAVVCVLGMVMLVPVVVSAVARVAGRLPLPVRFAARDAVRHRTRTVPAVAAVAATVAGVVALGISTSSDEKENRETYHPMLAMGNAFVSPSYDFVADPAGTPVDWAAVRAAVLQHVPGAGITPVVGVGQPVSEGSSDDVSFRDPAVAGDDGDVSPVNTWSAFGTDIVVSDGADLSPTVADGFAPSEHVAQALAAGKVVLLTGDRDQTRLDQVTMRVSHTDADGNASHGHGLTVPALVLYRPDDSIVQLRAVVPPAVVAKAGIAATTVGLELDRPHLSTAAAKDLGAALEDLPTPAAVQVERGYQAEASTVIVQLVLAVLAAILMLGGTLTAMFLALSDARPDLATLAAVGAAPKTRRSVASAYTFVVAFVGAVLGMVIGFVPGIAITWPLTTGTWPGNEGPYLDIPWLLIAVVVVGLPVLTTAIVAACVRSRLPMVSRLN